MNYELMKKLKDAGFPLKKTNEGTFAEGAHKWEEYALPTLSEIIDACGDRFAGLTYDIDFGKWHTQAFMPDGTKAESLDISESPEEAVANLWLALQKK